MSNELNRRWSAFNVYVNVSQNRMDILSTALSNKGIPFYNDTDVTCNSTMNLSTNNNHENLSEFETELHDLDEFKIHITNEEWKQMKGPIMQYNENRTYPILQPGVWTDILSLALYYQMELPCAFVFKHSKIYESSGSLHYLRIIRHCKSKTCRNPIFCYLQLLDKNPGDTDFDLTVKTRDTIWDNKHEDVKRPFRGLRCQKIRQEVFYQGCGNWQKSQIAVDTKFGHRVGPHIPNLNVLRQAKTEYVNKKLGVEPSDGQDIINTIEQMKYKVPYHGFIHEVKRDKFFFSFSTSSQLYAYKKYLNKIKKNSVIQVDGTGSIIKPLTHYDGSKSGHTFLYSITINFNGTTLSVHDMLTENQDTNILLGYLIKGKDWVHQNQPPLYVIHQELR